MGDETLDCLIPPDLDELAVSTLSRALQWLLDPVGVVRYLQPCLATSAQLAVVYWMLRISLQLLGQSHLDESGLTVAHNFRIPLHDLRLQTAARRTLVAHARPPNGHPRN
jgi:hypothetical protein